MSRPLVVDASCQPKRSLSLPAQALHIVGMTEDSPESAVEKIALELLMIAEPEFGFRTRGCRAVGESFLRRLDRRLRNRADGQH